MKIKSLKTIILSSKYGSPNSLENILHLPSGQRSCSMVQVTLEDRTTGLGEGYIGIFAPNIFTEIIKLSEKYLIDKNCMEITKRIDELQTIFSYWGFYGATRHVISAIEIALIDAKAKLLRIPAYDLFGGKKCDEISLYGSGGDSISPIYMEKEFKQLTDLGIDLFKIRAKNYQLKKAIWTLKQAKQNNIKVAIDMTQNLQIQGQSTTDVIDFNNTVQEKSSHKLEFIEEPLSIGQSSQLPFLKSSLNTKIAGGETITHELQLCEMISNNYYHIVQPDATVIGGMHSVDTIFKHSKSNGVQTVVHSWGGPICLLANYHIAFANGAELCEYPLPQYELRTNLLKNILNIKNGKLQAPQTIGLGIEIDDYDIQKYCFNPKAIYNCKLSKQGLKTLTENDTLWE